MLRCLERFRVFSLVCKKDLAVSIPCLQSFLQRCLDPLQLILVSDGSLDKGDAESLRRALPGSEILFEQDMMTAVAPLLEDRPFSKKYREWCPWARKILDIPIYADGDFAYVDSDIYFLRDFTGLAESLDCYRLAFMHAYANVYSGSMNNTFPVERHLPIAHRLNSGFMSVASDAFDIDLVERFLGESIAHESPSLWEQSAWACLAAHVPSGYFDAEQITFPQECFDSKLRLSGQPVAIHFVGATRHLFPAFSASWQEQNQDLPCVKLRIHESSRLSTPTMMLDVMRHRVLLSRNRRAGIHR